VRRRSVVGAPGPTIAVLVLWIKESSAATIKVPPPHAPPPPPLPPSIDGRLGGGPDCMPPTGGGDHERRLAARCSGVRNSLCAYFMNIDAFSSREPRVLSEPVQDGAEKPLQQYMDTREKPEPMRAAGQSPPRQYCTILLVQTLPTVHISPVKSIGQPDYKIMHPEAGLAVIQGGFDMLLRVPTRPTSILNGITVLGLLRCGRGDEA